MRKQGVFAIAGALAAVAAAAPPAGAAAVTIDGHAIAPPVVKGQRVLTTIVLTARAERAARLRKGVVRVSVPRRALLRAPKPTATTATGAATRGTTKVSPLTIRVGDRIRGVTSLTRKSRARLARRPLPTLTLRSSRILSRASILSNDELQRMIEGLGEQLRALAARVDALATSTTASIGALNGRIDVSTARINQLDSGLSTLRGLLALLAERVDALELGAGDGGVDGSALQGLRNDLDGLLGRVGLLEGLTDGLGLNLGNLGATVSGLLGSMAAAESRIDDLVSISGLLSDRLDDARSLLGQVPDLIAQVGGIDSALSALTGRVTGAEGLIDGLGSALGGVTRTVDGLVSQTGELVTRLDDQETEIALLQSTVGTLTRDLTTVTGELGLLQGTVSGLNSTVVGLGNDLDSLTSRVLGLEVVTDLICSLPLIGCR